ncbi:MULTISPECIES: hypothetical protein [Pseudomonas]|nr:MULTISPECIES: hypothetical protein [unclassified Pseudomonas]MCV2228113.1 hypothetical protein [Pseudomonas sp. AU10]
MKKGTKLGQFSPVPLEAVKVIVSAEKALRFCWAGLMRDFNNFKNQTTI